MTSSLSSRFRFPPLFIPDRSIDRETAVCQIARCGLVDPVVPSRLKSTRVEERRRDRTQRYSTGGGVRESNRRAIRTVRMKLNRGGTETNDLRREENGYFRGSSLRRENKCHTRERSKRLPQLIASLNVLICLSSIASAQSLSLFNGGR